MLLYHISLDLNHDGRFEPRIPEIRMDEENKWIPRVCFSSTIEGCFSAIPDGGQLLEGLNIDQKGCYRLFILDTEKEGLTGEDIMHSDELYEKDYVRDAEETGETWITRQVAATTFHDIYLDFWREEVADCIPHAIMKLADEEYDGDYLTAYIENTEEDEDFLDLVPSYVVITNAKIVFDEFKSGETFERDYFTDEELEDLINRNPDTEFLTNDSSQVKVVKGTLKVSELAKNKKTLVINGRLEQ